MDGWMHECMHECGAGWVGGCTYRCCRRCRGKTLAWGPVFCYPASATTCEFSLRPLSWHSTPRRECPGPQESGSLCNEYMYTYMYASMCAAAIWIRNLVVEDICANLNDKNSLENLKALEKFVRLFQPGDADRRGANIHTLQCKRKHVQMLVYWRRLCICILHVEVGRAHCYVGQHHNKTIPSKLWCTFLISPFLFW